MAMLEVKDLQVYYGMIQAIKGISFEVNQGEVIALIGANGAGKTTTLHTVRFVREKFHMTILLIEHDMKLVSGICEKLTVLNFGEVLCEGKTSDVLNDPQVVTAYLGE